MGALDTADGYENHFKSKSVVGMVGESHSWHNAFPLIFCLRIAIRKLRNRHGLSFAKGPRYFVQLPERLLWYPLLSVHLFVTLAWNSFGFLVAQRSI